MLRHYEDGAIVAPNFICEIIVKARGHSIARITELRKYTADTAINTDVNTNLICYPYLDDC